jgi:hypothetical protein
MGEPEVFIVWSNDGRVEYVCANIETAAELCRFGCDYRISIHDLVSEPRDILARRERMARLKKELAEASISPAAPNQQNSQTGGSHAESTETDTQ